MSSGMNTSVNSYDITSGLENDTDGYAIGSSSSDENGGGALTEFVNTVIADSSNLLEQSENEKDLEKLLKIQTDHTSLCSNIVLHKNDVINGDENVNILDKLHNFCKDGDKAIMDILASKIKNQNEDVSSLNNEINTYNRNLRNEHITNSKNITRRRMLALSQEKNIYKKKVIYTMGAFILAIFSLIIVVLRTYGKT